jgi:hypothetical protein
LSDHRGLFIDVDFSAILGGPATPIPAAQYRDLHSTDPKATAKYRDSLMEYFVTHNVEERAIAINSKLLIAQTCNADDALVMDAIDRDISRGMAAAAKKCKCKHRHPWSPVLKKLQQTVDYWKSRMSEILTKKWLLTSQRAGILAIIDLPSPPTECPPKAFVQTALRKAQKALRVAVKKSPDIRRTILEDRADAEAAAHNRDSAKVLKRIVNAEASKSTFNKSGALSSIMVPGDEPDTWERIYDQTQITATLIERNKKHFGQAHGTPFTVSPL